MKSKPNPYRVGLVMHASDVAALDRLALREEVSRANLCRRILRAHLRTIAAAPEPERAA